MCPERTKSRRLRARRRIGCRLGWVMTPRQGVTARSTAYQAAVRLAGEQHGALSVRQLRGFGLDARAVRALVASGHLDQVEPTVFVACGSPDTWFRRLQVGLLALGDDAWVSHEAAAALLSLDRSTEGAVEFTVRRGVRRRGKTGAAVHTTAHVGPVDVITVRGFRCTSATRTVLDLAAAGATSDRLAGAVDSAMRLHLSAPLVLVERLSQLRAVGRRGVRTLDALLLDSGGETMLERRFLALVRGAGLPRPETQRRICSNGRHVAASRLPVRRPGHGRRGVRSPRPFQPDRPRPRRPTPQRTAGPRIRRLRVHLG